MPRMPGKALPYVLDKMGLSTNAASKYIQGNSRRAIKLQKKAYDLAQKKGRPLTTSYSDTVGVATKARQRQVAGRYGAGAIGLGTMSMYNGRRGNERRAPMPTTRARPGSGRNP